MFKLINFHSAGFPIYDDQSQQPVTVDDDGLFPVIDDTTTTTTESTNSNTTIVTERPTTVSLPSQTTPSKNLLKILKLKFLSGLPDL
jgi:hypothetical protein